MIAAVTHGREGTAMKSFANTLTTEEIGLVVDFIHDEFIIAKAINTRYHTRENGWPNHERYKVAYPFAIGEQALDTPDAELSIEELRGKHLFLKSCISCHDRARVNDEGEIWEPRAVSFPREHYSHRAPDAISSASIYASHDVVPSIPDLTPQEKEGESLFQENCAFCHGADGTGKNWIGSFLDPHPRDLTNVQAMNRFSRGSLLNTIQEGLPGSSMPAWKSVLNDNQINAIIDYISKAFYSIEE